MRRRTLPLVAGAAASLAIGWVIIGDRSNEAGAASCIIDSGRPGSSDRAAAARLTSQTLHRSEILALPMRLAVVGDNVVVIDGASDSVMHIFRRGDGAWVRSLGRRGAGPGEYRGAWSLDPGPLSAGVVWVFDVTLRRLTPVEVGSGQPDSARALSPIQFRDGAVLTGPVWVDQDRLASLGLFYEGRVALYDRSGERLQWVGPPPPGATAMPPPRPEMFQATLAPHPDRRVLAAASRYVSRLDLVGLDDSSFRSIPGPVPLTPRGGRPNLRHFAYIDVTASRDHLLALFSGRTAAEHGSRANFAACVHVFDWDGAFQLALPLADDVLAIATDEAGTALYALTHDPAPALIRYDLSEALSPKDQGVQAGSGPGGVT